MAEDLHHPRSSPSQKKQRCFREQKNISRDAQGLPWWSSGKESAF